MVERLPRGLVVAALGVLALGFTMTGPLLVQWALTLAVPAAVLLLARPRVTDTHLLLATALGMLLIGGASLLAIVHAALSSSTYGVPPMTVSIAGLFSAPTFATAIFLLVADRQAAPRVPPRWSPEMATVLSVTCTITLWRALESRTQVDQLHPSALPALALVLGLMVSGLLYLTLRLLRSNWQQVQRLAHTQLSRAFDTASDGVWEYVEPHDDSNRPALIMGISADVTELERVARERRESERRFRAIFDSALQGQVLLDDHGVCLEVNNTALAIVGARRDDVLHTPFALGPWFTGLSDAQGEVERALEQVASGRAVRFEAETHLLDGRIGLLECSCTPLACDAGVVQQVLCELRDVTDRRRSDEALREIGALTTMGRLAARVAHEINNPLAGIQNAFLLLGDAVPSDHPHRRFLASIDREIQRIASVTRSLYETYRQDAPPGAAGSMSLAVNDAVRFLDQVNHSRNIRIHTDLARAPALVPVPDALLRQTLYNLVQNAVEASPIGGEVSIVVCTEGDECVITVHDEGARVPDHLRERIFEPMSGARTAQLRTGSMGIGLSLVRQSVRALGGTVTLLDTPGHGATFEVRLPMTSVVREVSGPVALPVYAGVPVHTLESAERVR